MNGRWTSYGGFRHTRRCSNFVALKAPRSHRIHRALPFTAKNLNRSSYSLHLLTKIKKRFDLFWEQKIRDSHPSIVTRVYLSVQRTLSRCWARCALRMHEGRASGWMKHTRRTLERAKSYRLRNNPINHITSGMCPPPSCLTSMSDSAWCQQSNRAARMLADFQCRRCAAIAESFLRSAS